MSSTCLLNKLKQTFSQVKFKMLINSLVYNLIQNCNLWNVKLFTWKRRSVEEGGYVEENKKDEGRDRIYLFLERKQKLLKCYINKNNK